MNHSIGQHDAAAPTEHHLDIKGAPSYNAKDSVTITLKEVSFVVKNNKKDADGKRNELYLVNKVSGWFDPGEMAALMGPSGSGKTTLLDVLAGRKTAGRIEGEVLFAGQHGSRAFLRRYCGYVEQFDTLLPILTVREMLRYTAELKRPMGEPFASKAQAVEDVLQRLGLLRCADVRIGSAMSKGISGGQAKRTNIALALVTNPKVMFLDEPTTGLDSYTANEVMLHVQALARSGVTVCATIHSPTAFCFSLFDRLMMLVHGRMVYFGQPNRAAIEYFSTCPPFLEQGGAASPLSSTHNNAEYLVDIITEADRQGRGGAYADAYASSALAAQNAEALQRKLDEMETLEMSPELAKQLATKHATVTPWYWGIRTWIKYRTVRNYTDIAFIAPRFMDKATIGLLVMTLYLGIGDNLADDNIINISAVLFMWSATTGFTAASYVPALVMERGLFVRERNDGLYKPVTYLTAKLMDELVIAAISSLGIAAYTFYGIQLQGSFGLFYVSYYVGVSVGVCLAYFVASFAPNMDVANALVPIYGVTLMFFAGFLIRHDEMPPWWKWYSYIDFARYTWGAVMINQFEHHTKPWIDGKTVLQYYSLNGYDKWAFIGYVVLFFAFFYTCTALILTFKKYQLR